MGQFAEPAPLDIIETGSEPEYFVTDVFKADILADGMIRLYVCSRRSKGVCRLEYTLVCSTTALATMARKALLIASEGHNAAVLMDVMVN